MWKSSQKRPTYAKRDAYKRDLHVQKQRIIKETSLLFIIWLPPEICESKVKREIKKRPVYTKRPNKRDIFPCYLTTIWGVWKVKSKETYRDQKRRIKETYLRSIIWPPIEICKRQIKRDLHIQKETCTRDIFTLYHLITTWECERLAKRDLFIPKETNEKDITLYHLTTTSGMWKASQKRPRYAKTDLEIPKETYEKDIFTLYYLSTIQGMWKANQKRHTFSKRDE